MAGVLKTRMSPTAYTFTALNTVVDRCCLSPLPTVVIPFGERGL